MTLEDKLPELTRDLVEILLQYDIRHDTFHVELDLRPKDTHDGYTDYENRVIWIRAGMSCADTRKAVIHELLHAYSDLEGYDWSETKVLRLEREVYKRLYGK